MVLREAVITGVSRDTREGERIIDAYKYTYRQMYTHIDSYTCLRTH